MHRFASGFLATMILAGSAGLALAAPANQNAPAARQQMPSPARPMAATEHNTHDGLADRMTSALNTLEADGCGDFNNFKQVGQDFDATVTQNGQHFTVTVDPATHEVTRHG